MSSKPQDAPRLLMPKATATWLVDNTALTFEQIADFTGMMKIEVEAIANGDSGYAVMGIDPVAGGELDREELEKAQEDPAYRMKAKQLRRDMPSVKQRAKGPRYTPVSRRGDKPDAIAWLLKHHPEISDAQIVKLAGTTKPTIQNVRDRTHPNSANIQPRNPAEMGLCTYQDIEKASEKGLRAQGKDPAAVKAEREQALQDEQNKRDSEEQKKDGLFAGFDFSNFLGGSGNTGTGN